ncbi:MAG: twitching motility protein PilT [Verrucomicrobiae bacterium]|nr:twitching motility protein PilT [Verrucomicrobiae bacterium]MCX7722976.1 twitching motility protein PilT [Verrucomicrobiae bacterium]MDW7980248.1 hypothetical protein [Verrucomicrobiales bacterium]
MASLWIIRILFLAMTTLAGYAVSQVRPEYLAVPHSGIIGMVIGFGFGWLLIAIDEMLKGFSLRAFSATTFGLILGSVVAMLIDRSGLFEHLEYTPTRWLIRLCLFLGFGYIGIVLAMRSNKEDFSLIIPYVRFAPQRQPEALLVLDTSAIIDGRIADLVEVGLIEGTIIVPRFVLRELQQIADSPDPLKRARGRRGLEILNRLKHMQQVEVKIHDAEFPDESDVDAKLIRLARNLGAKLVTNDFNLGQIAALQSVKCINIHKLAKALKTVVLPGESISVRLVREGKDKGQGVGYLADGTMVVVNDGHPYIGQEIQVQVQSLVQTSAGVIVFAEAKSAPAHTPTPA